MSDTTAVVIKLTTEQEKRFVVLDKQIQRDFTNYQTSKTRVLMGMYEVWKDSLWVAQHDSLQEWLGDLEHRTQNHLALRQTFYDHMTSMAKLVATGAELETAAMLTAKSSGAPRQLERLGVTFGKDGRGDEAEYEVEVPDDFEDKTEGLTLPEYVERLAGMSRGDISKTVRHDSGAITVSFSNLLKIPKPPDKTAGWYVVDAWVDSPDGLSPHQMYVAFQASTTDEIAGAVFRKLNKTFEA